MKKMTTLFKKDPDNLGRVINEINPENSWVFSDEGVKATRKFDGTSCTIVGGKLYKRYDVRCREIREPLESGKWICRRNGEDFPDERKFNQILKPERGEDEIMIVIESGQLYGSYELLEVKHPQISEAKESQEKATSASGSDWSYHWPHWVPCDRGNPADKYHWEAFDNLLEPEFTRYTQYPTADEMITISKSIESKEKFDGTFELCGPKVQGNPEGFEEHVLIRHGSEEMLVSDDEFMEYIGVTWQDCLPEDQFDFFRLVLLHIDVEGIVFHHPDNIPNGLNNKYCKIRKSDFGFKRNKK